MPIVRAGDGALCESSPNDIQGKSRHGRRELHERLDDLVKFLLCNLRHSNFSTAAECRRTLEAGQVSWGGVALARFPFVENLSGLVHVW